MEQCADTASGLLDNLCACIYSAKVSDEVQFEFISRGSERLTGLGAQSVMSSAGGWLSVVHPDDLEEVESCYRRYAENGAGEEIEYRVMHADGSVRYVKDVSAVRNEGREVYVDGIVEDMTAIRRAEADLERTQMLQRIGGLAAGIAHEINTPIQFIGDNLTFLSDSFGSILDLIEKQKEVCDAVSGDIDDESAAVLESLEEAADLDFLKEELPQAIDQSRDGVKRVSKIVAAMRDFSHLDERRMARADINKALESCLVMVRNEVKYVADVRTEMDRALPGIVCCIDELNQVFMNLIINAAQSIEQKIKGTHNRGLITVGTLEEQDSIVVFVSDTGVGVSEEVSGRMFEPFFTTKPRGKGTGQGLAMAKTIVERKHKGKIEFETEPGQGATFKVCLPR
ncbi:Sensor protein FixL [Anaerohalosphaera lusitana]|uniref:histidine kinase n=1 Tax=Anaerohalosphaera lusitana TaxID=1936003 RepID=A0A1U9NLH8_9BACT|nr:PAS domain-containing sensor histidine kinase [Anaerohalosphaera lusitana]AQT68685.1 Sensor protein FixL [Anaerohalosphaera lusitana]